MTLLLFFFFKKRRHHDIIVAGLRLHDYPAQKLSLEPFFHSLTPTKWISAQGCYMASHASASLATNHTVPFSVQSPLALLQEEVKSYNYDTMTQNSS